MSDSNVASIAAGGSHTLVLIKTEKYGDITIGFGNGEDGQLGNGDIQNRYSPTAIYSLMNRGISSVHCGAEFSIAVSDLNKEVYSFGYGDFSILGHGDGRDVFIPTIISSLTKKTITSVACGDAHTLMATAEGELISWGRNQNGQLGNNTIIDSSTPQVVTALADKKITRVACGAENSLCCTSDGQVYSWGYGLYGSIGDGSTEDRHLPTKVVDMDNIKVEQIACGWRHSLVVSDQGVVFSWGFNRYGQCGHGTQIDQLVPKKIEALANTKISLVDGGWRHSLLVDENGRLFATGWNKFGQLGLGTNDDAIIPRVVDAVSSEKIVLVAAGWRHSIVATEYGNVYGFGRGTNGALGCGEDIQDKNLPVKISELSRDTIDVEKLIKEAHPVVMQSILPSDRYAVVPDNIDEDGGDGMSHAVPEVDSAAVKRQKT